MRYINIIIYILLFTISKSQNLVLNPSFETYTTCPTNFGQINVAIPWQTPNGFPSDYYNVCATGTNVSIPKNLYDRNFQYARNGNAYVGMTTMYPIGSDFRQYATTNINLTTNSYYICRFYVSNVNTYRCAHNNIALSFTSTFPNSTTCSNCPLNLPMHIYKFGNPVIKDTLNWTEIMGIYKANGSEQYITIGNFKDDTNTKIDTTNYGTLAYAAYYMIDDVSVEPICAPFWSYRDTTVVSGDSVLIGPCITGLNINWYDSNGNFITNAPGIYVKPNSPTYYTASEDFCNGITTHTINVMVTPTSVEDYNVFTNSISLFPNPTTNNFTISNIQESSKLKVDIADTQGKLYSTESIIITNNKATIKTNLPNGVYFVSITDTVSGLKTVKKLIVQK